ncbi:MAG: LON peptidase substrate-binding domain-containing protein [Anaerolineae bacterium]|nr:LON peptidase substrate-binding domain-containing protein [Anaerolineae bacterium]
MTTTYELPLFPLSTVLFPGMPLPLHIFEPRYKLLINACVRDSSPFGVVLIHKGSEVGAGATIHTVGTTAVINNVRTYDNGEMDILTIGQDRFIVESTHNQKPYLTGVVRDYPLIDVQNPDIERLATGVSTMVTGYLDIFAALGEVDLKLEQLPSDPQALAFLAAVVLHMPMKDKQELLTFDSLPRLLRHERKILSREQVILKDLIDTGTRLKDDLSPFSQN